MTAVGVLALIVGAVLIFAGATGHGPAVLKQLGMVKE